MERKIAAEIEFRIKDSKICENGCLPGHENICKFLPCDVSCYYEYPLKIMCPSSISEACCQWIFPIIYGGGLVEGDKVNISFKIGHKCSVTSATMSFPKVYCCENGKDSQQHAEYYIDSEALLCVLPDPLVCFKNASYNQSQTFHLASDANLVILDWFSSGRYMRGERWAFTKLKSVTSIFINGKLEFKEAQNIQNTPFLTIKNAMKAYNIVGTCMIMGYLLEFLTTSILTQLEKCRAYGEKPNPNLLFSVSPLNLDNSSEQFGCIIRFAAVSVPEGMKKIEDLLQPLFPIIG
ncbi:urease accessory protein D [Trichonephila inaurata madagascariensis]|uniref:Urease accessory protein D n=1 Tax=Trichonephila inaurata madagascariensis TaxID=2747483 RepID=A0A8X7CDM6_9ARAC|nr:urease accessory protein D [Trichonephila inaurata madagascariensis]